MPKIRWQDGTSFFISTDDLFIPAIISFFLRVACITSFVIIITQHDLHECRDMLRYWIYASTVLFLLSVIILLRIIILSGRGSVFESEKRINSVRLMKLRVVFFLPIELLFGAWGMREVWFQSNGVNCLGTRAETKDVKVLTTWFAISVGVSFFWALLLLRSRSGGKKLCHGALLCALLRCTARADDEAISFISSLVREFQPGLDLAFTDIVAMGALLWRRAKIDQALAPQVSEDQKKKVPVQILTEMERACWFAMTVYGWPLEAMRKASGWFLIGPFCACIISCFHCCRKREGTSEHDNCCECNGSAMSSVLHSMKKQNARRSLDMSGAMLVHASWVSGCCLPSRTGEHSWAIFLDPATKCVVLVTRGTLSVSDTVVDFWCDSTPVPSATSTTTGVSEMCHAGVLSAAQGVFEEVMTSGVLQCLLDKGECPEGGDPSIDWAQVSGFDLMLVGHSLGGAIASLLSQVIAANVSTAHWSSRIRCRLISPMGGLYTRGAAEASVQSGNSYSVTLGDEGATCVSRHAVETVRDDGLLLLAACPYHKLTIIMGLLKTFFYSPETLAQLAEKESWPFLQFPLRATDPREKFDWAHQAVSGGGAVNTVETCFASYNEKGYADPMYIPGEIIHLKRNPVSQFDAVFISKEDLTLSLRFPGAITDHFPWIMIDAFDQIMRDSLGPPQINVSVT